MAVGSNLVHNQTSVGTSATLIGAAKSTAKSLVVSNTGASTVFLGGSGVTTANGFPLAAGASIDFSDFNGQLYGIVASGTVNVAFLGVN